METGERRTNEVLKDCVFEGPAAAVGLDHHHLVGRPGVDITVENVADVGVCPERADGTAAAPVAVDVLDQDIVRWALLSLIPPSEKNCSETTYLDSHAFILICDLNLVDIHS
jgi:hypothetical protein